jgi:integrase
MVPTIGAETMFDIITVDTAGTTGKPTDANHGTPVIANVAKRERKSTALTDRMCETRVTKRTKYYDRKCPGLFVSITTSGVATFYYKFVVPGTGKQSTGWLGVYNPETFNVENARSKVYALRGNGTEAIVETMRQQIVQRERKGRTVDQIIAERVDYMKALVKKADGEMRPRIETWSNVESHLRRLVSPRLGKKIASEVKRGDIQTLSDDIVSGEFGGKPSVSNARHMRRAASGLFRWALRRDYVTANPCGDLEPLDTEHARTRVLSADEIKKLWWGLDREDMPWDRRTRLALKFALTTMLRSAELLSISRDELNSENGTVDVPARRVKKRRVINQPLSDLALEIIREALTSDKQQYVFASPVRDDMPLNRKAMSIALRGTFYRDGRVKSPGICDLLGMKPFTPHDLRRTAATMCGELGLPDAGIALCLDHQANKDENGKPLPTVTNKVYNRATRVQVEKKRKVLDAWAVELRRIIGTAEEAGQRVAA